MCCGLPIVTPALVSQKPQRQWRKQRACQHYAPEPRLPISKVEALYTFGVDDIYSEGSEYAKNHASPATARSPLAQTYFRHQRNSRASRRYIQRSPSALLTTQLHILYHL